MKTFHGPILIFARQRTSLDNLLLLLPLIVNMEAPNRVLISRQQFTETLSGEIKTIYKIDPSERSTGPDRSTDPGAVSGPTLGCVMTRCACSLRSHLVLDPRVGFSHLRDQLPEQPHQVFLAATLSLLSREAFEGLHSPRVVHLRAHFFAITDVP